jgi:hypothetical protein
MHRTTPQRPARGGSGTREAAMSPARRAVSPSVGRSLSPRSVGQGEAAVGSGSRRTNFGPDGGGGGWGLLGAWRVCLSAPRRATLFAAIMALGMIALTVARTARAPATPDTGKLVSDTNGSQRAQNIGSILLAVACVPCFDLCVSNSMALSAQHTFFSSPGDTDSMRVQCACL